MRHEAQLCVLEFRGTSRVGKRGRREFEVKRVVRLRSVRRVGGSKSKRAVKRVVELRRHHVRGRLQTALTSHHSVTLICT